MELQDIRTLRLLEAVEGEGTPSQRELAASLNVSLGLVNSFLKRLARKGYFKITNLPANRVRYLLTPKGMAEKSRLTYEYIQYSFQYYRQTRASLAAIFQRLASRNAGDLVFWGSGELAEIAYVALADTRLRLTAIIDPERAGERFLGQEILLPESLAKLNYDAVLVTTLITPDEFFLSNKGLAEAGEKLVFIGNETSLS